MPLLVIEKPFAEPAKTGRTEAAFENDMRAALADLNEAFVFVIPPPSCRASAMAVAGA